MLVSSAVAVDASATSAGLKTNRRRKLHALKKDEPAMRQGLLGSAVARLNGLMRMWVLPL